MHVCGWASASYMDAQYSKTDMYLRKKSEKDRRIERKKKKEMKIKILTNILF